jgi:hypothetical protein
MLPKHTNEARITPLWVTQITVLPAHVSAIRDKALPAVGNQSG